MADFMEKLTAAIEQQQRGQKDPQAEWDEHDYEKFLKERDARADKYLELLDKCGESEEAEARIAKEMGWDSSEDEDENGNEDERMSIEEMNAICEAAANEPTPEPDPHREGIDWIRTERDGVCHPLQHRCSESALKYWRQAGQLGLDESTDKDLDQFLSEFQTTGAKLAGALNGIARGARFPDAAFTIALLKRALGHLCKSQAGLEAVAARKLLPEGRIAEARKELFEIREGILGLKEDEEDVVLNPRPILRQVFARNQGFPGNDSRKIGVDVFEGVEPLALRGKRAGFDIAGLPWSSLQANRQTAARQAGNGPQRFQVQEGSIRVKRRKGQVTNTQPAVFHDALFQELIVDPQGMIPSYLVRKLCRAQFVEIGCTPGYLQCLRVFA